MTINLRSYQIDVKQGINAAWDSGSRNVLAVMPTGSGKCFGRDTPIMMFDGTIKMSQNVSVFDKLMGPDGKPRTVINTVSGRENMYRVTPIKGDSYVVNESHILSLKRTSETADPKFPCQARGGEIRNITVRDYLKESKWFKHIHKGYRASVDFPNPKKDFTVPPYLMGLWLAEGTCKDQSITTPEPETLDYLRTYAAENGYGIREVWHNNCWTVFITNGGKCQGGLLNKLRWLKVLNDKHVPHEYKTASHEDRLQLLAGYLDGDGHLSTGHYDCIAREKRLADDIAFICRSVGLAAYVQECKKTIKKLNFTGTYYRTSISGDLSIIPNRVPRRKAAPRLQKKDVLVTGISVEPLGEGDYFGFEVSGPDRLFLLGDFTVTHNSLTVATLIQDLQVPTCLMVHRGELVAQLSEALATVGIMHRIIASKGTRALCVARHIKKFGRSFYHPQSPIGVVSVQTLVLHEEELKQWCKSVRLWIADEAHHYILGGLFGKAINMFPNANGLGATATPLRCDRKSLAAVQGGVFNDMVEGPSPAWMIEQGFLSRYRYFAENPSIHMTEEDISKSTGEFKADAARRKSHESRIVGDIVETYLKNAAGLAGMTFTVDIETAIATAEAFNKAGIPAAAVSGKTPDAIRAAVMDKFQERKLLQLVNVDLFDEGLDVVGVECVSMGRPTLSLGKFRQQAGRMIRPVYAKGYDLETQEGRLTAIAAGPKPQGMIFDHVNNWLTHKMPATNKIWSLVSEEKGKKTAKDDDDIPLTNCKGCKQPYERFRSKCPHCGEKPVPLGRSLPEQVDGDVTEFSDELLKALHGEIKKVDGPPRVPLGSSEIITRSIEARHRERQEAQHELRHVIALWAGMWRSRGAEDAESYRRFFLLFGTDVKSAQALGRPEAVALTEKIRANMPVDTQQRAVA